MEHAEVLNRCPIGDGVLPNVASEVMLFTTRTLFKENTPVGDGQLI